MGGGYRRVCGELIVEGVYYSRDVEKRRGLWISSESSTLCRRRSLPAL